MDDFWRLAIPSDIYHRTTVNMQWCRRKVEEEDDRIARLAKWDAVASSLVKRSSEYIPRQSGNSLDFDRPVWDETGSDSKVIWTGRLAVAAAFAVCNHSADHRTTMEAHRLDYTME